MYIKPDSGLSCAFNPFLGSCSSVGLRLAHDLSLAIDNHHYHSMLSPEFSPTFSAQVVAYVQRVEVARSCMSRPGCTYLYVAAVIILSSTTILAGGTRYEVANAKTRHACVKTDFLCEPLAFVEQT